MFLHKYVFYIRPNVSSLCIVVFLPIKATSGIMSHPRNMKGNDFFSTYNFHQGYFDHQSVQSVGNRKKLNSHVSSRGDV